MFLMSVVHNIYARVEHKREKTVSRTQHLVTPQVSKLSKFREKKLFKNLLFLFGHLLFLAGMWNLKMTSYKS